MHFTRGGSTRKFSDKMYTIHGSSRCFCRFFHWINCPANNLITNSVSFSGFLTYDDIHVNETEITIHPLFSWMKSKAGRFVIWKMKAVDFRAWHIDSTLSVEPWSREYTHASVRQTYIGNFIVCLCHTSNQRKKNEKTHVMNSNCLAKCGPIVTAGGVLAVPHSCTTV